MKRMNTRVCQLGHLRLHFLPILVWLAVLAGVIGLFYKRSQRFEVLGMAQGQIRQIAASCDGRLKILSVELFEEVVRGQILALLDDEQLNAQIATASAEIERLMAELIPTQETLLSEAAEREIDWNRGQRRFLVDVETARLRILELKTVIESDRIMLENLALEVKIVRNLLEQQAVAPYELQKAEATYNTLAKKIEENEHLMEQCQQDLKEAQQRCDEFAQYLPHHPSVDNALDAIRKAITVQEKVTEELLIQRRALTIKSPIDGVVVQILVNANDAAVRRSGESILRMPGEVVLAGDPILAIAETKPREIIAYASEEQLASVREKMVVELVKKSSKPVQVAKSQVVHIGPTMEMMPTRLWRNPNIPQWGRPMLIKIPPDLKLVPGELVGIRRL